MIITWSIYHKFYRMVNTFVEYSVALTGLLLHPPPLSLSSPYDLTLVRSSYDEDNFPLDLSFNSKITMRLKLPQTKTHNNKSGKGKKKCNHIWKKQQKFHQR